MEVQDEQIISSEILDPVSHRDQRGYIGIDNFQLHTADCTYYSDPGLLYNYTTSVHVDDCTHATGQSN